MNNETKDRSKHSKDALMVSSVNREALQTPNVDIIAEEEEEQEDNVNSKKLDVDDKPKELRNKFILETVVLGKELVHTDDNNKEQVAPPSEEGEVQEIKIEEGYATRQMDEYFRQTIAAIKEELKLENKTEKNHHTNNDYEMDVEDSSEIDLTNKNQFDTTFNRCTNRTVLFQNLMYFANKKSNKQDKITSWLVLLGCFVNQFLIEGICFNYFNVMSLVSKKFKTQSKLIASMPGVLLISFLLFTSPIALFFTKRCGLRLTSLIGASLSAISLLNSSIFLDNFVLFNLFYGIFTGAGLSLIYVPTMIATSKWFVKKRLFACSISVMGASLGAVFYPLITQLILSRYSLFNTLFLLSSVQLNSIAASLLLFDNKSQILASSIAHNYRKHSKNNSKINGVRDSETQSQVSTSTNPNLTLKQYWRKFIQTRKTQSNTRKNLFHLIAEEKRKTRTLSKSSLEDGFVITTSNNLLAPNENVIVNRQVKLSAAPNTKQKLITRIANSLRSLTHSSHTSSPRINEPSPLMSVFEGPIHADPHDILHTDSDEDDEHNSYGFNANIPRINPKNPRYMNYRNSLTNSVRGSLMECSVPEEECNEEDVNSGCDGTCSMDEEDQCGKKIQRLSKRRSNFNRPRPVLAENEFNLNEALKNLPENNVGYSVPTLVNLRRFISTIETASFLNLPLNLEPIEYNLRNCLIKKSAEKYRKRKFNSFGIVHDMATMFIDYLIYTFNLRLFFNQMLLTLNFSFLLSSTGFVIILFYIGDYSAKYHLAKLESTYILCLIGLSCGLGRIVSTISYKVNESNAKGRIFAYILTLFLSSGVLFISVFLCTTLFSFSMFAMAFGIFIGFNFNLRTLFLYDIIGLEWSDDSLFFYGTFVQALGVFFGIPLAGFIYDYSRSVLNVVFASSLLFLLSGLILLPGRNLRSYCKNSMKSINKFYLQRRNVNHR